MTALIAISHFGEMDCPLLQTRATVDHFDAVPGYGIKSVRG